MRLTVDEKSTIIYAIYHTLIFLHPQCHLYPPSAHRRYTEKILCWRMLWDSSNSRAKPPLSLTALPSGIPSLIGIANTQRLTPHLLPFQNAFNAYHQPLYPNAKRQINTVYKPNPSATSISTTIHPLRTISPILILILHRHIIHPRRRNTNNLRRSPRRACDGDGGDDDILFHR